MAIVYLILGIAIGSISPVIENVFLLFSILIGFYLLTLIPLLNKSKDSNKIKTLIADGLSTYLFTWIIIFLLISNIFA